MLEASRVLDVETNHENTQIQSDNDDMETESVLNDNTFADTLLKREALFQKFKANDVKQTE